MQSRLLENHCQMDIGRAGAFEVQERESGEWLSIRPEIVPTGEGHAADFAEGRRRA